MQIYKQKQNTMADAKLGSHPHVCVLSYSLILEYSTWGRIANSQWSISIKSLESHLSPSTLLRNAAGQAGPQKILWFIALCVET